MMGFIKQMAAISSSSSSSRSNNNNNDNDPFDYGADDNDDDDYDNKNPSRRRRPPSSFVTKRRETIQQQIIQLQQQRCLLDQLSQLSQVELRQGLFELLDRNQDDSVSVSELAEGLRNILPYISFEKSIEMAFEQVDKLDDDIVDGKLERTEFDPLMKNMARTLKIPVRDLTEQFILEIMISEEKEPQKQQNEEENNSMMTTTTTEGGGGIKRELSRFDKFRRQLQQCCKDCNNDNNNDI